MRFDGVLLLSDLDGTFLNDEVAPVAANTEAVKRFINNGGLFSVASGRPPQSALRYIGDCGVNFPAVLFNGAMAYDFEKEKPLFLLHPDRETEKAVFGFYEEYKDRVGFIGYYEDKLVTAERNRYSQIMEPFEALPFLEAPLSEMPFPAVKYLFIAEPETINELYPKIKEAGRGRYRATSAGKYFVEILAKEADKGTTMRRILEMKKGEVKTVVAVGDYLNDLCILEKADVKAVVKGAPKALTDIADYVTKKTNNEGAVADLIDNLEAILSAKAR